MFEFFKKKKSKEAPVSFQIMRDGRLTFDTADADIVTKGIAKCASTDETFFSVLMTAATFAVADNAPVTRRRLIAQFKEAVENHAKYLTKLQAEISLNQQKKSRKEDKNGKN